MQLDLLAYAEGEFLPIHPFAHLNGRAFRALLSELLVRLDFPPVEVAVEVAVERGTARFDAYTSALAHYDNGRIGPLVEFRDQRIVEGLQRQLVASTRVRCRDIGDRKPVLRGVLHFSGW